MKITNELLGRRFQLVDFPHRPFVTVVRFNPAARTLGLWCECPKRKETGSADISFAEFDRLNLARI